MKNQMEQIKFSKLQGNAAQLIGTQWMLVTAGQLNEEGGGYNTMTASWGGLGFLWNRPVAFVFVRPNRYTAEFMNREADFTLSFMPEKYRKDLVFCGRNSGRDVDKAGETQLSPIPTPEGLVAFEDADLVLECRKMFVQDMAQESFIDWSEVSPQYYEEGNPLHVLYIAEIKGTWVRNESAPTLPDELC